MSVGNRRSYDIAGFYDFGYILCVVNVDAAES